MWPRGRMEWWFFPRQHKQFFILYRTCWRRVNLCFEVESEGIFLGEIGKKSEDFCSMLFTVTSTTWFPSPLVFEDLRFLQQQLKVGGSLALFTSSLCLPLKVALFFVLLVFIYTKVHIFPIETIIRNALKGGKPNRKPYHPYGFRNVNKTTNQRWKLKFVHEKHFEKDQKPQRNCTFMSSISGGNTVLSYTAPEDVRTKLYPTFRSNILVLSSLLYFTPPPLSLQGLLSPPGAEFMNV